MDRQYKFIVNPSSCSGRANEVWQQLEAILKERRVPYQVYFTQYLGHATELAEALTSGREPVTLVVCGGDGTVGEVINGIVNFSKVTLGYLPLGSANDFATGLGITGTPQELLLKLLATEDPHAIDLGQVSWEGGSRRFGISSGFGVDAYVCRMAEKSNLKSFLNKLHLGGLTYAIIMVKSVFVSRFPNARLTTAEGQEFDLKRLIFAATMNVRCEGGGVAMTPRASFTDGKLSLCVFHGMMRLPCIYVLVKLLMSKHEGTKGVICLDSEEISLQVDKPLALHADGEDLGDYTKVTFKVLPGVLNML